MNQVEKIVFDTIYGRRSVRSFVNGKGVEQEKIVKLLKAAMAAPSACNFQPWEFVVVTNEASINQVKDSIAQYGSYNTPLIIVVCSYTPYIPWEGDQGVEDCCAAMENMLIAATALDLGSVWIGGFDRESIRKILNIPEYVIPIAVAYFGYPAVQPAPRTKFIDEAVHWQKYDTLRDHPARPGNIIAGIPDR